MAVEHRHPNEQEHRPEAPLRPMLGGTQNGSRPENFTYWRVGRGDNETLPLDFWVELAGEWHCLPPHHYPITTYQVERWTRVFYITDGQGQWVTDRQTYALAPGDVLIVPPKQPGVYQSADVHHYHQFSLAGRWPSLWGTIPKTQHLSPGLDLDLSSAFAGLREALILGQPGYALKALGYFYAIFGRVQTLTHNIPVQSQYPDVVRNALIYLEENCTRAFQSAETAAHVHVSPAYLRALFERWVGLSPKRYHTHCRVELAKQLLSQQSLSVQSVARQVGFSDSAYFSRIFKQATSVSPSAWHRLPSDT